MSLDSPGAGPGRWPGRVVDAGSSWWKPEFVVLSGQLALIPGGSLTFEIWRYDVTYQDFLVQVHESFKEDPKSRYGQVWFNVLQVHRPELAYQLMGTPLDPFYRDCVPPQTEMHIEKQW
jgi:hypothetical protein